jgi:hypothetical protein
MHCKKIAAVTLVMFLCTGNIHAMAQEKKEEGYGKQLKTAAKHTARIAAISITTGAFAALAQNEAFKQECTPDDHLPHMLFQCTWKVCRNVCLEYNHPLLIGLPYCVDSTIKCYPASQLYPTADDAWHAYLDPVPLCAIPAGIILYILGRITAIQH